MDHVIFRYVDRICWFIVQMTPPHKAEVLKTAETLNITWKSGYENHSYLKNILQFEVLLQASQSKDNQVRSVHHHIIILKDFFS